MAPAKTMVALFHAPAPAVSQQERAKQGGEGQDVPCVVAHR